ncbi:MAG: aminoacyl-tRNA hydrolase [Tenericutes bacterium HGW-Tenericutes-5]|jgi:PTH1 family peptidyl-tRNA hydrolase|nr:MAG: aminoacyl-tRNA hydrolase [Tenericutes bacterium HGW-Tenericutes-5]
MKKLIVGLGNPGKKYANSKHNIGFIAIDKFAQIYKLKAKNSVKFNSEIFEFDDCVLAKPKTFMNNSGYAILKMVEYFNIDLEDVLIIYDDVALPFSKLRLRYKGGSGGHNGIKSILTHLGSENFNRLRIGIDKSDNKEMKDYVLSDFSKTEMKILDDVMIDVVNLMTDFINGVRFEEIMNKYNNSSEKDAI